jgi:hypothetical protein
VLGAGAVGLSVVAGVATWVLAAVSRPAAESSETRVASDTSQTLAHLPPIAASQATAVPAEQRADQALKREGHAPVGGGVLHVPPSFQSSDGAFDLLMHFHGSTPLVQESVGAAKVNALVYILNLEGNSGMYDERYAVPATFEQLLDRIRDVIEKRGLKNAKVRRIALVSWSAGYGAIGRVLASQKLAERIDAVMVLDGINASYVDRKTKEKLDTARLEPFIRFAKEAAGGRKLFTLTHSELKAEEFAGPSETAEEILRAAGTQRIDAAATPAQVKFTAAGGAVPKQFEKWLEQKTEARVGGLHVRGYAGRSPENHLAHLLQMSVTVLPELVERWK